MNDNPPFYRSRDNTPGWDSVFRAADNAIIATVCPDLPEYERECIAQRIVAALNVCRGVPTDELDAMKVGTLRTLL